MIILSFLLVSTGIYALVGLRIPSKWKYIRHGSTRAQVKATCENVMEGLHDMKGDFCEAGQPFMRWSLNVIYGDDDTVKNAHLVLFLGTRNTFKRVYVRDLASQ